MIRPLPAPPPSHIARLSRSIYSQPRANTHVQASPSSSSPSHPSPTRGFAASLTAGLLGDLYAATDLDGAVRRAVRAGELRNDTLDKIENLPGTAELVDFYERSESLVTMVGSLRKGVLPRASELSWPAEPFRSAFLQTLSNLEMPRFCRAHPRLMAPLIDKMLDLVTDFETDLIAAQASPQAGSPNSSQPPSNQPGSSAAPPPSNDDTNSAGGAGGAGDAPEDGESGDLSDEDRDRLRQEMEDALRDASTDPNAPGSGSSSDPGKTNSGDSHELQLSLTLEEGPGPNDQDGAGPNKTPAPDANASASPDDLDRLSDAQRKAIQEKVAELMSDLAEEFGDVTQALDEAERALGDVSGLLEGSRGFDRTTSLWKKKGWREFGDLRKKLETLKELRDLVRSLGRGGGRGPLRRAPREVYRPGGPPGVIDSPLRPEQTRGLCLSDDLSRMLPAEAALMAHGRRAERQSRSRARSDLDEGHEDEGQDHVAASDGLSSPPSRSSSSRTTTTIGPRVSSSSWSRAAAMRRLHNVRRAERQLMSYERSGWLDDEPSRVTSAEERRPAAELGPIILCLDTSGSMRGARETIAKALALECLRGAHRQRRAAHLVAFSGPEQAQELELSRDAAGLGRLLDFLAYSFDGGTDVDRPFTLALERLGQDGEWSRADILLVTDGEIPRCRPEVVAKLERLREERGLEVHGLLVGGGYGEGRSTEAVDELCTHVHVFQSWSAVKVGGG